MPTPSTIAIIGSGIAGLTCARLLAGTHRVTVFEAASYIGGHTNTVSVETDRGPLGVDTGFIVFNHRTYPNFCALMERLGVASQPTDMSFSVRDDARDLEYAGSGLNGLFAQRRNLLQGSFLRMVREMYRFNREAVPFLESGDTTTMLGGFLKNGGYSDLFRTSFIIPMGAAIWSASCRAVEEMPAAFFMRFFHNHGFLNILDKPTWRVIKGGSSAYIAPLTEPFRDRIQLNTPVTAVRAAAGGGQTVTTAAGDATFDHVILACHSDTALRLLGQDASATERELLGALPYQLNEAILHTDASILPRNRRAWASWNYLTLDNPDQPVAVSYHMNALQGFEQPLDYVVTLNGDGHIDPAKILRRIQYHHPVFTVAGAEAQQRVGEISGRRGRHFCGAYWRYGFHEDGVMSALRLCEYFGKGLADA